ncbi:MAG TPA: SRPBCC domain-containing protein [Candidatus Saccharimonadales bacterium]|jgi:uncharacterized protein YndB with AHSA1/START domain|nr:SRPBCC domain-containing protein [Candidatus Saccharimonadales bacterium]
MQPVKEVEFNRTFDAPVETVWKAWTDPEMLKAWWGPENTTIPECEVDVRVGGRFYIVMEATEGMGEYKGTRWPMEATYTVVEPNAKLSYTAKAWTEGAEATTQIDQVSEMVLTEEDGKTNMYLKATINKTGPDAGMAAEGMQMGYNQQFDKLVAFLAK